MRAGSFTHWRLLLAFLISEGLYAQVFKTEVPLMEDTPFFREEWVKTHHIREMFGNVSHKRDGFPISRSEQFYLYRFDREGRLLSTITTYKVRDKLDTIYTYYQYTGEGRLSKMVKSDAYGYFGLNYFYDGQGRLVRLFHTREKFDPLHKGAFQAEKVIWDDSIAHISLSDEMTKSVYYNEVGKPYKEVVSKFDSNRRLVWVERLNLVGNDLATVKYSWDDSGRLHKFEEIPAPQFGSHTGKHFTYDNENRLDKEEVHKDNVFLHNRKISYNREGLIELQLIRNRNTGVMEIIEYEYLFFE